MNYLACPATVAEPGLYALYLFNYLSFKLFAPIANFASF
jgi:hypothetical protein